MSAKRQILIIAVMLFQFLEKSKTVEGSSEVETYCEDLCPIEDEYTDVSDPEIERICERHCFLKVEVEDFGRRISSLQNDPSANVVLSPFSIASLLNLLILGTGGNTHKEIKEGISYSTALNDTYIQGKYQTFLSILQGTGRGAELYFRTRLFFQESISILDSFENTAINSYFAEIDHLDFQTSPNTAEDTINNLVSSDSEGIINDILSNTVNSDTKCIGVSLMSFKSSWAFEFNSSLTKNGIFNTGTENITIPMMTTLMTVLYYKDDQMGIEIISLPYIMNSYAMYIIQPLDFVSVDELQVIEDALVPTKLKFLFDHLKPKFMEVTIPRMKLVYKLSLKEHLMSFGINQIFNPGANFGNLTSDPDMIINDLFHAAFLEITEAGTNTDIASDEYVTLNDGSFRLNRPFIFFIRDKDNELIIFWGKVINPEPLLK